MKISPPLIPAILLRRYKRFLADVRLADGREMTVHTPNTGSMLGCAKPGTRIWLRDTFNSKRKYRYTWEMSETTSRVMVGVHTGLPPTLVTEGITNGRITELQGYDVIRREVPYGLEGSRIDLLLENGNKQCYVEVKNVTASLQQGAAVFPDAVSERGRKHLRELMHVVQQGQRAVIFYCIQRDDINTFSPAEQIDPEYAKTLHEAVERGVEALAYCARVTPDEIYLLDRVQVLC